MREGWQRVPLGEVLRQGGKKVDVASIEVVPYAGLHWYAKGTYPRGVVPAHDVKARSLTRLSKDQVTYNRMWATKAAFGVVDPATDGCLVTNDFPVFDANHDRVLPAYLSAVFATNEFQKDAALRASGTTERRRLKEFDFLSISIALPPVADQRRIVDLIASIDAAIDSAVQLSDAIDPLWTAAVDQATAGAARVELGSVMKVVRAGGTPSRKTKDFFGGDVPWLKSGEVDSPSIGNSEESISTQALAESSAWLVPKGAVLVAMYGATAGAVGYLEVPMATNQAVLALIGEPTKIDQRFLYHWLRSRRSIMKSRATGAAQPNLSKERVLKEPIPNLPVERQRYVAVLLDRTLKVETESANWIARSMSLRGQILNDLLSGNREIPDSYDRFLEAAS